jgi:hypothetical protein
MTNQEDVLNFIANFFSKTLKMEDETFAEYSLQILKQEDIEEQEKFEIIREFLQEATEDASKFEIDAFLTQCIQMIKEASVVSVGDSTLNAAGHDPLFEVTRDQQHQRYKPSPITRKEREEREKLLAKYGYETEEIVEDKNGELDYSFKTAKFTRQDPLDVLSVSNKDLVKQKELQRRMEQKKRHEEEVKRNRYVLC